MDMRCLVSRHEKGMMIHEVLSAIYVHERRDVFALVAFADMQEICWYEVEVLGIPFDLLVKYL